MSEENRGGTVTLAGQDDGTIRTFETGATRDTAEGKLDYEGFISPLVMERYARYMDGCRVQSDGNVRDSDNWQKGIPKNAYMKSAFRHFMDWWFEHRLNRAYFDHLKHEAICALMFNCMGYLHEELKQNQHNQQEKL